MANPTKQQETVDYGHIEGCECGFCRERTGTRSVASKTMTLAREYMVERPSFVGDSAESAIRNFARWVDDGLSHETGAQPTGQVMLDRFEALEGSAIAALKWLYSHDALNVIHAKDILLIALGTTGAEFTQKYRDHIIQPSAQETSGECEGCKRGWQLSQGWHWDSIGHMHECTAPKAECSLCASGVNSFIDPVTGKKMHARNGDVTICSAQKASGEPT